MENRGRGEEPAEQGRWSLIVARDLALPLPCVHRLIFSFRLPPHSPPLLPSTTALTLDLERSCREITGLLFVSRAADGLCAYVHLREGLKPLPCCCKGIFRCFSKFLQTGLMADDCVPKVTPGENEPSDSSDRGPNLLGPDRERYNCSIAPCFRPLLPSSLAASASRSFSPFQHSSSCARMCADHDAACNLVAL